LDYGAGPGLNFDAGAPFTFAGWVRTTERNGTVVSQRDGRDGSPVIDLTLENGALKILVRADGNEFGNHAEARSPAGHAGDRPHCAFTRQGDAVELWLDGLSCGRGTGTHAGGAISTDLRALGCERYWVKDGRLGPDMQYLEGDVDE